MVETTESSWGWLFRLMLYSFATALCLDCRMRTWISWVPCCMGEVVSLATPLWNRTDSCPNACVRLYILIQYHVSCRYDCGFGIALECSVLSRACIGSPTSSNCKVHLHWLSFSWCRSFSATSNVHCEILHHRIMVGKYACTLLSFAACLCLCLWFLDVSGNGVSQLLAAEVLWTEDFLCLLSRGLCDQ